MRQSLTLLGLVVVAMLVATIATAVVAMVAGGRSAADRPEPLPVIYDLPRFDLVDQDSRPWSSDELRGTIWVADFMFTRCNGICPMQSRNMQALQEALRGTPLWDKVRLVSISIDADNDTPAILRDYAERYRADPSRWTFLTGPKEEVWSLSRDHFRLDVMDNPEDTVMPIGHSGKFIVVDGAGRVRAYHSSTDATERAALIADLWQLAAEQE